MTNNSGENPILKLGSCEAGPVLYFFGARHTNNPDDIQFVQLKNFWDEFLNISSKNNAVFVEGVIHEVSKNYIDAIKLYGETGAIQWLAKESNIQVLRPEPNDVEQRKYLCSLFDPKVVAYSLIIQNLGAWFRHSRNNGFKNAIENSVDREVKYKDIYEFIPNNAWFFNQHKEIFGEQNLEDKNFLDSVSDPRKGISIVNRVISSRTKMRNEYILVAISEALKLKKNIFIVYGSGHIPVLENSLRELFDSK